MLLLFLTVLKVAISCSDAVKKPFDMNVLSLMTFTGYEPRDNRLCQTAIDLAFETANQRLDILPNYHLVVDHQNEGRVGMFAPRLLFEFLRRNEQRLIAPIIMGPFLASGCRAIGTLAHHLNFVSISGGCASPAQVARRDLYPNMYRARGPASASMYTRLFFLVKFTGIRKLAILANVGNQYTFDMASLFRNLVSMHGFDVQLFDVVNPDTPHELVSRMKHLDVRIVSSEMGDALGSFKLMCAMHRQRMSGSRYLFLLPTTIYVDIDSIEELIAPNCSKTMVLEQLHQTLYIGAPFHAMTTWPGSNRLGHTREQFEEAFDQKTNRSRSPDYDMRHQCYDRALQTILTLDEAEKCLKTAAHGNVTLLDFATHPLQVMHCVNESASRVNIATLRYGPFSYSSRLEYDSEPQFVGFLNMTARKLTTTGRITLRANASFEHYESYVLTNLTNGANATEWLPADSALFKKTFQGIAIELFIVLIVAAVVSISVQLFQIVKAMHRETRSLTRLYVFSGCILVNLSAILRAIPNDSISTVTCSAHVALLSFGFGCINVWLANRIVAFEGAINFLKSAPIQRDIMNNHRTTIDRSPAMQQRLEQWRRDQQHKSKRALRLFLGHIFIALVLLVAFWWISPMVPEQVSTASSKFYDITSDTFYEVGQYDCKTTNHIFIYLLLINGAVPLVFGMLKALRMQKTLTNDKNSFHYCGHLAIFPALSHLKRYVIALMFVCSVVVCTLANVSILSSAVSRSLTLSISSLILSTCVTLILGSRGRAIAHSISAVSIDFRNVPK